MYCGAGIHSPVSGWLIQPGYIPFDDAGGFFLLSRLVEREFDELLLEDDDDESRFFFDFFLLPLSLRTLSLELMLVMLSDRSFLISDALIRSLNFFLLSLLRKSKPWNPFDGPLVSSTEYFVLIRSNKASRRRILSTLRCALRSFFCSLWIFFVNSLDSSCVIFWMYFCFRRSSRWRCLSRRICFWTSSFCLQIRF